MNYLIFGILFISINSFADFNEACRKLNNQKQVDLNQKKLIHWSEVVFKTKDCEKLVTKLRQLKSLSDLLPTNNPHAFPSPFDPTGTEIFRRTSGFNINKLSELKVDEQALYFFKEFQNIKHIDIDSFTDQEINLEEILRIFPKIESISYNPGASVKIKVDSVVSNNINLYITGEFDDEKIDEGLVNHIKGIQSFSGRISELYKYKNLKTIGVKNVHPDSRLKELLNFQKLENLFLSTKYISEINDVKHLKNLKFLLINCLEDGNISFGCSSRRVMDVQFISGLHFLEGIEIGSNLIERVPSVANLKNLRFLNLGNNEIIEFPNLNGLSKLTFVGLSDNKLSTNSEIKFQGEYLDLGFNQIENINELNISDQTQIILEGNPVNRSNCPTDASNPYIARFCSQSQ